MVRRSRLYAGGTVAILPDDTFPLYLVHSQKNVLIDASITAKTGQIQSQLSVELAGEQLHHVLLTHSHYDHTGALSCLQANYPFSIIASRRTKEVLENPKAVAFIDRLNQEFKRMLGDQSNLSFTRPRDIFAVGEGDIIPLSESQWIEVYETPGHTRCSISFLLQPQRVLFVGDAAGIMERDQRIKPLFLSSYKQYENSLLKIRTLEAEILAMPHNAPIRGASRVDSYLDRSLKETRRARDEILTELKKDQNIERVAEQILAREYPRPTVMGPREAFLINLTAMVRSVLHEFLAPATTPT